MKRLTYQLLISLTMLFSLNVSALAQYVWLDENGRKQYSDQAPPPSISKNRILKFSGKKMDDLSDLTSVADEKVKQPPSWEDKNLDYKKRRDEFALKEKKEEIDAKNAAVASENCRRMNAYKQSLESGQRMAQIDSTGTRSFVTDEQRAQELNELNLTMSECK